MPEMDPEGCLELVDSVGASVLQATHQGAKKTSVRPNVRSIGPGYAALLDIDPA